MFELPIYLEPAALLEYPPLPRAAEIRRLNTLAACRRGDWDLGLQALRPAQHHDWLGEAVLLMHLGDEALRFQRLEIARQAYRRARHQFRSQVAAVYRQNEALGHYGLALTAWLLEDSETALERLEQAIHLCATARIHWVSIQTDYKRARHCSNISGWLTALADKIAQDRLAEIDIFGGLYAQPIPPAALTPARPLPHIQLPGESPLWEKPRSWHVTAGPSEIIGE